MKKTKKAFKSSICGGCKGKVVIQKTNLSLKKARASNVVAARAARAALKGETRQSNPMRAGLWPDSLTFITPGKDKDPWWDGEQTQDQAKRHLLEVDAWIATLDIYI